MAVEQRSWHVGAAGRRASSIRDGLFKGLVMLRDDWSRVVLADHIENGKRHRASQRMVLQQAAAKLYDGQLLEQTKVVPAF